MELRTTLNIEPSSLKITYNDKVMFIGSCFASSIGLQMEMGRMPVMINPAGTVYNPVSVCNTIDTITEGKEFVQDDLYCHNGTWLSFYHYTDFSSDNPGKVIEKINQRSKEALSFLKNARFLFITFGTARVYKWKKTGMIVSNCHKIPSGQFEPQLLTINEIVTLWSKQLDILNSSLPPVEGYFYHKPSKALERWCPWQPGKQIGFITCSGGVA